MAGKFNFKVINTQKDSIFTDLFTRRMFTDVKLVSIEGNSIDAHKVILSNYSDILRRKFIQDASRILMIEQSIDFQNLELIIAYIYNGEVSVEMKHLNTFLSAARTFGIKGIIKEHTSNGIEKSLFEGQGEQTDDIKCQTQNY